MAFTTSGRNALLTDGMTQLTHVSIYSDLGTTEVATTRQAVTWTAAASGVRDNNAQLTIPIPAAGVAMVASIHSAVTAGSLQGIFQLGSSVRGVAVVDTTVNDTLLSRGHGLTTDDRVFVSATMGEALPAGLSATVLYFVRAAGLTADAFTLAVTSGGAAVDITALGECAFFKTVPNTFASPGNVVIATGAFDVDLNAV